MNLITFIPRFIPHRRPSTIISPRFSQENREYSKATEPHHCMRTSNPTESQLNPMKPQKR